MRKLLLFTFTVALLSLLSVNTFAQWGKTATVASDTELIQALENDAVQEIKLLEGYYDFLGQHVSKESETRLFKAEPMSGRSDCDYFIQVANTCVDLGVSVSVSTSGTGCPVPEEGYWDIFQDVAGSTVTLTDGPPLFNTVVPGMPGGWPGPGIGHPYDIEFTADMPGEYIIDYYFPDDQFVRGNIFVKEKVMPTITLTDEICETECAELYIKVERQETPALPSQARDRGPYIVYGIPGYPSGYPLNGGELMDVDEYMIEETIELCDLQPCVASFTFTFEAACTIEVFDLAVDVYDVPELTNLQYPEEICGDQAVISFCEYVDCVHEDYDSFWTVNGMSLFDAGVTINRIVPTIPAEPCNNWLITVPDCGTYSFVYTVSNGFENCVTSMEFAIEFFDEVENVSLTGPEEACIGDEVTLSSSWDIDIDCYSDDFTAVLEASTGASIVTQTWYTGGGMHIVTADLCGLYTFTLTVTNPPCEPVVVTHSVYFYDAPEITLQADDEICGLEYIFAEPIVYVDCELHPAYDEYWTLVDGPSTATATFDGNIVTVSECGTYTFSYTVFNGFDDCEAVEYVAINFYDIPVISIQADDEICGLVYDPLVASATVECEHPDYFESWDLVAGPGTATFTSTGVEVSVCGVYTFSFTASNGFEDCTVIEYVSIEFFDEPENVSLTGPEEACIGDEVTLYSSWDIDCYSDDFTAVLVASTGASIVTETWYTGEGMHIVTADECGLYTFTLTVTNPPCEPVVVTHSVYFYDIPVVDAGEDQEVCMPGTTLTATVDVDCDTPAGYWGVKTGAPGGVVFDTPNELTTGVTVDECGEYTFVYTVENGPCGAVTDFVIVNFYDEPDLVINAPEVVCGYETPIYAGYTVDCAFGGIPTETWTWEGPAGGTATITFIEDGSLWNWNIEVDWCGVYTFTYQVENGPCVSDTSFSINFYEEPKPRITGEPAVVCAEVVYTVHDDRECPYGEIDYIWTLDGLFIGEGETVTVEWTSTATGTLCVTASLADFPGEEVCEETVCITVVPELPVFEGQVKYWNEFETYMPTPFPTQDYATYPHDYFYVTLYNGIDSLQTVIVEPRLREDLTELMSFFDFDLEDWIALYGCEGYHLKIWDGGLVYYDMSGGSSLNPPLAARHLGNNYTYNNWGGVNATDALAIQLMATGIDINAGPYNFDWVGPFVLSPQYGYYSYSAADVNTSDPYLIGGAYTYNGITALDALTANYRAVGLLDVFPNSQPGIQYSKNFRVTGRLVPELPYMTWDDYFDYNNVDDIEFNASNTSYLYFTEAVAHKYTSEAIDLGGHTYINVYYLALGDINSSYVPTSSGFKAETDMLLAYKGEQIVRKGDVIDIPISIDGNAQAGAITLNLNYNTSLIEVLDVNYDDDYYAVDAEAGTLRIGWFSTTPANFTFGDAIAKIQVRVLSDITADTRFFELEAGSELADINAQPIKNIGLETVALSSVGDELFVTNYPNPFRETTMISYNLPEAGDVSLVVYNKLGQIVETLVSTRQEAGTHQAEFGRSDLTPGVYFYKIVVEGETNTYTSTNSMIFMQ